MEQGLATIFDEAAAHSIPTTLLVNRMNLAAARRLSPSVLVAGLREELLRLLAAARIVDNLQQSSDGRSLVASSGRAELLNTLSIYLSSDLSSEFLVELLDQAAGTGRTLDRVFQVCAVVLRVNRSGTYTNGELVEFGTALLGSRVASSGYPAIGSFVARAASMRREEGGVLRTASRILRQGGGLPQMELELGRRR